MEIELKSDAQKIFDLEKDNKALKEALESFKRQNKFMGDELLRSGLYRLQKDGTIVKRFSVNRN